MSIKAGIIGSGLIGPVHLGALRRIGDVEVTSFAGSSDDKAKKAAKELGIEKAYGDWREMLKDDDLQVVHVCVPNNLHYPITKEALKAGKHVVCEKPLAMTTAEAKELCDLAEETGLVNAVHFNIRYYPLMRQLKNMVEKGDFGRIFSVHGSYLQDWLYYDTDYNWRLESDKSGKSRAIADIGSHWMDLVEYVSGMKISEVLADFATFHPTRKKPKQAAATYANMMLKPEDYTEVPIDTEDYATVMFRFSNGERGVLTVSQVSAGRKNRLYFELDGSKQSAAWESEMPNQVWIGHREKYNELMMKDPSLADPDAASLMTIPGGHNEGFHDTSRALLTEVYADIRNKKVSKNPSYPTFSDGLRELVLTEKIIESSSTDSWVKVN
ncbi:MAG: Gfo/Idh/MocA family protein [Spirochaetota bacterium]